MSGTTGTKSPSRKAPKLRPDGPCPVCMSPTCQCGPNCQCTEEFSCSQATSVLQSLSSYSPLRTVRKRGSLELQPSRQSTGSNNQLQETLQALPGVRQVSLNTATTRTNLSTAGTTTVTVVWDEPPLLAANLTETLQGMGYRVISISESIVEDDVSPSLSVEVAGGTVPSAAAATSTHATTPLTKVSLGISGMTCTMCSQSIVNAIQALEGVASVDVSLATDSAIVTFDPQSSTTNVIQEAIEDVGYDVEEVTILEDHNSASTAAPVVASPQSAAVAQPATMTTTTTAVQDRWERLASRQEEKVRVKKRAFLGSLAGALPILLLSMIFPHVFRLPLTWLDQDVTVAGRVFGLRGLLFWFLATPVQFLSGYDFYRMTYFNLRGGTAGMDVLVSLGTTASYGYACWGLWKGDAESTHFFETSATLICFVLAGKWMQALAVRRTSQALSELMKLQSSTAIRVFPTSSSAAAAAAPSLRSAGFNPLQDAYQEETVPIDNVQKGDLVKVIRGSSIPADGRIRFGEMSVNESMVTGESMPVLKTPGSDVLGGTVCVETSSEGSGAVFVEVTGVGSDTALAQIIQLVQDAQTRAVPIQSFADSVSAVFVPTVCIVSLLTYMTWYALCESQVVPPAWYENVQESPTTFSLTFAIACLVISCPCALGLATPTAVIVGSGKGAQLGVLMKGGEALEVASKVTSVIFDKTGTLTKGQPVIVDYQQIDRSVDPKTLLWMLGSLEKNSEHPLAKAVVTYAEEKLGDYLEQKPFEQPTSFQAFTGRGAEGILNDSAIAVGSRLFTTESGIHIPIDVENYMQLLEREGKTAVLVSVDGNVCLVMGIADRLKSDAIASVSFLRDTMKLDVWMVTGDTRATANAIGRQLGLPEDRIISEALPAAKVHQVLELQGQDHIVAMVGDGINDSPALAQADVGISLGSGAKIATEASDMVLVRGNVAEVCTALHLSRRIFQRIQLNLLFSLVYNCLGIPIAAGVFYPFYQQRLPPTLAGAAMALSSVSVVLSSLSLRLYRSPTVYRRRSPVTAWSREIERQRDDELNERLLVNDHLGQSDYTDATARVDNRSAQDGSNDEVV